MISFENELKEGDVLWCWNVTEEEPQRVLVVADYPRPRFGYAKTSDGSIKLVLFDDEESRVLFHDQFHLEVEETGVILEVSRHEQDGSFVQDFGPTA